MTISITKMKEMNKANGQHWFDKETMDYFGSKVETKPNRRNLFITSEYTDFNETTRAYTVRHFNHNNGRVTTVGEFLEYKTLEEAREARNEFSKDSFLLISLMKE